MRHNVRIVISGAFNKKKCAFCWSNNCVIVNMHGRTTIKNEFLNWAKNKDILIKGMSPFSHRRKIGEVPLHPK
jgi:hypothetical protein